MHESWRFLRHIVQRPKLTVGEMYQESRHNTKAALSVFNPSETMVRDPGLRNHSDKPKRKRGSKLPFVKSLSPGGAEGHRGAPASVSRLPFPTGKSGNRARRERGHDRLQVAQVEQFLIITG